MNRIVCPKCGQEYLACEIYYPKDFLGTARNIIKDDKGHIKSFNNEDMNLHEEFVCYRCNTLFNVDANVEFTTSINIEHNFDEDFESFIYDNDRLTLKEE